jgi:hypothetical protein
MADTTESTTMKRNGTLSEKQELLLSRFHDGECSCLSAFFARRLLSKNTSAQHFLSELKGLSSQCSDFVSEPSSVDLWTRIDARIEQEQRAEFYVGTHRSRAAREPLWERINLRHATFGGLSGAAIAAAVLMVLAQPQQIVTFSAPAAGPVAHNQLIQQAGITNANTQRSLYQTTPVKQHRSLEVDWMRANGSLKLIPDPSGSSAIIWVRPRSLTSFSGRSAPQIKPTPLGRALEAAPGPISPRIQPQRYQRPDTSSQSIR